MRIPRAPASRVSFGAADAIEQEDEEEETVEEQMPFASVLNGDWKFVDVSA